MSLYIQASALLYECGGLCAHAHCPPSPNSSAPSTRARPLCFWTLEGGIHWDVTHDWGRRFKGKSRRELKSVTILEEMK